MYEKLIEAFYQNSNPEQASGMAAYMKNQFSFLGLTKPERVALQRAFLNQAKKTATVDWAFIMRLWGLPEREFQYLALDYLSALSNRLQKEDIDKLKVLITHKSWWDTVDNLATITGILCAAYPELVASYMIKWSEDSNIWLVRISVLFQLKYKKETNTEVLSRIIRRNSDTKEFFINKAIGWALREYSKTNKEWVKAFIEDGRLHPLSVREGSKYIN